MDQLIRLDDAKSGHLSPIAETTASVSAAEVDAVLKLAEEWRTSPAWPEVRRGLRSATEYVHSVGVLAVGSMLTDKLLPRALTTPGSGRDAVAAQDLGHANVGDPKAELESLALDAAVAPAGILARQAEDQVAELRVVKLARPTRSVAIGSPFTADRSRCLRRRSQGWAAEPTRWTSGESG